MKKFLFGLIATMLISGASMGQKMSDANQKKAISSQMVTLVHIAKTFHVKGQTYEQFLEALTIPSPTFPSQDLLFKKIFVYCNNGTPDCDIIAADNSIFSTYVTDLSRSERNQSTYERALTNPPKKWWQIVINFVANAALTLIAAANDLPAPPPIDIFPGNPQ